MGEEGEQESEKRWLGGISSRIVVVLFSIRGVIIFSRSSNDMASSCRKFLKSLGSLSLRSFNKFSWVYSFLFFQPLLHPSALLLLLLFQAHSQCCGQPTSFCVTKHVGYRRIRLQLNYSAKILHRLGTPSNIIVQ